jgi:hypothetical protein
MRRVAWLGGLAAVALLGCGKPGPHAAGSGYGTGIPRVSFTFGNEPPGRGWGTEGVNAPSEQWIGRITRPPAKAWSQAGRVH